MLEDRVQGDRRQRNWTAGLIALSLTFLGGYGGMISLAQLTVAGIAGYALAILGTSGAAGQAASLGWPWWVAIPFALATATERDRLRAQLDAQPAHRAAGDGVDLARYVLRAEVVAALLSDALDSELVSKLHTSGAARDALRSCARTTRGLAARFRGDLRSEAVEGGEQKAVEGAGGHGASVATGSATGKARVE